MFDYRVAEPLLSGRERQYLLDAFDRAEISGGSYVARLEAEFARATGARHAVACSNGTAALHLALLALGIGPGDKVLVPTLTFVATANAVHYTGAEPVFVDSDESWCMDPTDAANTVTKRTKAVIPVHLYGQPVDMDALAAIGAGRVVVDAAEAVGAEERGRRVGSTGDATTFSMYGNKILCAGEGGIVTSDSDELAERMRLFRGQGMDAGRRYWHHVVGHNYRMTNLQAAVGLAQVEDLGKHVAARRAVAAWYAAHLPDGYRMQPSVPGTTSSRWMVAVECDEGIDAARVMECLEGRGIETRPVFPPLHLQPCYAHLGYRPGDFPVAERLHRQGVVLPTHAHLQEEDVAVVCRALRDAR